MKEQPAFVFFGTPRFAVVILDALKKTGLMPSLVVTAPDKPQGRGLSLAPPPVKTWADENGIPVLQPLRLDDDFIAKLKQSPAQVFVVAAYGKIIPRSLLDIPPKETLNVHPSLLPKYRGASPIESALLSGETETGVSIMLLDEAMDHGPVLAVERYEIPASMTAPELEEILAQRGGALLAKTLPEWIEGSIDAKEQSHEQATFTKKITKEDGLLETDGDAVLNYRKYRALYGWPGTYFFATRKNGKFVRVNIKKATFENGRFRIERVLPEGGREMNYDDFKRGL